MKATAIQNAIRVMSHGTLPDGVRYLETRGCDYTEVRTLPNVVEFNGERYGFTGWNSDRGIAYYRTDAPHAMPA
jgi:hypothetical protein